MARYIGSLLKLTTVNASKLALALNPDVKEDSNERRIERFMSEYDFDFQRFGEFLLSLLPQQRRLAFVTVCPAHHRALLDYDQPEERPPKEVASPALERLSTLQQVLFEALRNGKAPSAIVSSKGRRLSGSELFAGLHLLMRTVAAPKAGRFLRLALTSGSPGFSPSLPKEGIHTVEHASIASRRQVMLFLAALLSDWPKPLEEGLAAAGLTYERLLSNGEPSDRTRWLEGYASEVDGSDIPAPPEPIEVGKRTNRIEKLTLEEVFELQPIAREQFELLGITEKDLSAATLSNEEWKTVQSVFSDRGDYPCLLHNRAVLSLMRLMRDKDLEPEDLPEALFRPVERATDKRESNVQSYLPKRSSVSETLKPKRYLPHSLTDSPFNLLAFRLFL